MNLSDPITLLAGGAPVTAAAYDTGPLRAPMPTLGTGAASLPFTLEAGRYLVIWDAWHVAPNTSGTTTHTTSLRLGTDTVISYDFPKDSALWPGGQSVAYSGTLEAGDYNVTISHGTGTSDQAAVTRIRVIRLPD